MYNLFLKTTVNVVSIGLIIWQAGLKTPSVEYLDSAAFTGDDPSTWHKPEVKRLLILRI